MRVVPLQNSATAAPSASRGSYTAPSALELGTGRGPRHKPAGAADYAGRIHARMGLWTQPDRIADRFTLGGSAAPVDVSDFNRNGIYLSDLRRLPLNRQQMNISAIIRAPVFPELGMGMACAGDVGPCGRNCDASTCGTTSTRVSRVHASSAALLPTWHLRFPFSFSSGRNGNTSGCIPPVLQR